MRLMSSPREGQGKVGLSVEHSQAMGEGVAAARFVDDFYDDASGPNFPTTSGAAHGCRNIVARKIKYRGAIGFRGVSAWRWD